MSSNPFYLSTSSLYHDQPQEIPNTMMRSDISLDEKPQNPHNRNLFQSSELRVPPNISMSSKEIQFQPMSIDFLNKSSQYQKPVFFQEDNDYLKFSEEKQGNKEIFDQKFKPVNQLQHQKQVSLSHQDSPHYEIRREMRSHKYKNIESHPKIEHKLNKNKNIVRDICTKCALYIETNPRIKKIVQEWIGNDSAKRRIVQKQIQGLRAIKNFEGFRKFYSRDDPIIPNIKDWTVKFYDEDAFVYIWNSSITYKDETTNQIGHFKYCLNNLDDCNQYRKWKQ